MSFEYMKSVNITIDKIVTDHAENGYLKSSDISNLAWLTEQAEKMGRISSLVNDENLTKGESFDKISEVII